MGMSNINRAAAFRWIQAQQGQKTPDIKKDLDDKINAPGFKDLPAHVEQQVLGQDIDAPGFFER